MVRMGTRLETAGTRYFRSRIRPSSCAESLCCGLRACPEAGTAGRGGGAGGAMPGVTGGAPDSGASPLTGVVGEATDPAASVIGRSVPEGVRDTAEPEFPGAPPGVRVGDPATDEVADEEADDTPADEETMAACEFPVPEAGTGVWLPEPTENRDAVLRARDTRLPADRLGVILPAGDPGTEEELELEDTAADDACVPGLLSEKEKVKVAVAGRVMPKTDTVAGV